MNMSTSIQQAMVDLGIARRTLLIYPASHDQVKRSLQRAFHSLTAVFESEASITLTVMKEGLVVNDRILDSKNTAVADLFVVFKRYQIAALTLSRGLGSKEFVRFLRLITLEQEKIAARGGIAALWAESRLDHITVREVDYSRLHMTEESEIQRSSRRQSDGSLWQAFVADLLAGNDTPSDNGVVATGNNPNPFELAALLNRRELKSEAAIAHYERALMDAAEVGTESSTSLTSGLSLFQQMIKELNPELQKQFLATTFDRCVQSFGTTDATRLVDGLEADLIVNMLRQANSDGKQISPSLLAFITKVGQVDISEDSTRSGSPGTADAPQGLTSQKIESLLAREQYDTYVDTDYARLLDNLTAQEAAKDRDPATAVLPWKDIDAELSDAGINVHAGRAMARMMTCSGDVAGYRDWARQLAYLFNDLLETRSFSYLIELMTFIRTEKVNTDPQRLEFAELLLSRFSDAQFVAKAIQMVRESDNEQSLKALEFLTALGEPVVLEILDGLDPTQPLPEDGYLIQILRGLSSLTAREALERIKDPRPDHVVLMLRLIRKIGDSQSAQQVRSLLDHQDTDVRLEALATLLKFNNKWGLVRLRELLSRPTESGFKPALELAGAYRVREVVPELISFFRQSGDLEMREATLRTLGHIGDSRAIPALMQLAHRRWGFSRKQIEHLQRVLYETLGGYPFAEIKHLLHYGLRQKDAAIQSSCRQLLREGTQEGVANDT